MKKKREQQQTAAESSAGFEAATRRMLPLFALKKT
jgi:hypothetical protein